MALLQIGAGKDPDPAAHRAHRPAIGIDLGTTNSLVATVVDGKPEVIGAPGEGEIVPSVVHYGDGVVAVGAAASELRDPAGTFASVKRLMGKSPEEVRAMAYKFRLADSGDGQVRLETGAGPKSPVEVSADILRALRARAEAHFGGDVRHAVITVPAHFDDAQRQATKDAAALAGLEVLRLLNEPTAAAVAYGLDSGAGGVHVVYDLGGGTFDVSILRLSKGVFEVVATGGDAALGGDDLNVRIAQRLLEKAGMSGLSDADWRRIVRAATAVKERLSFADEAEAECDLDAGALRASMTRAELEGACAELVGRTIAILKGVMRDAKLGAGDADAVVLVGGATRMPCVRHAVRGCFGMEPRAEIDPDRVVAAGAAIQADILAGNRRDGPLLLDVIPLSLGIEIGGGLVERIVPRNTTVPITRAQHFTTQAEGQTKIKIHVVQGERELAGDCRSLARFELGGIPPLAAGTARIKVVFRVDMDGLLTVSAAEESTGKQADIQVKPSYGLGEDEIAAMIRQSHACAAGDRDARSLIESREEAAQMVAMLAAAIEKDGAALLSAVQAATLREKIAEVERAAAGDDPGRIRDACKELDRESAEFAERRMDLAMKSALKGTRI